MKIFNHWMAPNEKLNDVPPINPLEIGLPNKEGVVKQTVFLKPGETDDVVAEVTVSDESLLKHFYKITFLKNSAWPAKAGTRADSDKSWSVGDIVKNVKITSSNSIEDKLDSDDKKLDFVCIRASGNGINPWFVATTIHDSYKCGDSSLRPTYNRIRLAYWTPDYDTTVEIQDLMKENWDTIESAWNSSSNIGRFPSSTGNKEPYIDRCHCSSGTHYYDTYNFDTSYINGRGAAASCAFFLNFNNCEASEVYDGCTVSRSARSEWTTSGDHLASDCI